LNGDQWVVSTSPYGSAEASLALLARGQQVMQGMPPSLPGLQRTRALSSGLAGQALMELGRYAEASDAFRQFLALRPVPPAGTTLKELREDSILQRNLARALLNQARTEEAAALLEALLDQITDDQTIEVNPLVLDEERTMTRLLLAEVLWLHGERERARKQLAAAEEELRRTGKVAQEDINWNVRLMGNALHVRWRLYPPAPAVDAQYAAALQALVEQASQLRAEATSLRRPVLHTVLALELAQGDTLMAQGQTEAARQQWQALATHARPPALEGDHWAMHQLALALLRLGQPQQAQAWVQKLQASAWRHPDLAALQAALDQALRTVSAPGSATRQGG
jgi:tetratricopeptide (TPR) repeat protein